MGDKESYEYVQSTNNTIKYKYLAMYNIYIKGKEMDAPWDYLQQSKVEFIMMYYADIRQRYEDMVKYTKNRIIKRSNSI